MIPPPGSAKSWSPITGSFPPAKTKPLAIEGYEFSDDGSRLLIYTNSKRVWRVNSRGDYWVLDLSTRELKKARRRRSRRRP